ncbi:MAG TPA: Crp/Fnr family transcriptional regulator [Nitratifractor sp.]|nr:Crp/Fnr family transcriptional regulator [Nitratifractor sp.]
MESQNYLGPFEGFADQLRDEFQQYGTVINFSKHDNPFDADLVMDWFYIIQSVKVKVYDINFKTNREQTLYLLSRGDMYDVVPLLDKQEHNLATEVLEAGSAIRFPLYKVREWIRAFPKFELLIYQYVAKQMRQVEELALDLSLLETKERLLKLLLHNFESIENRGVNLLSKLSHAEIASLIGTVRHIIDRHLKSLKSEGVLESGKGKKVEISNLAKLLKLLDESS